MLKLKNEDFSRDPKDKTLKLYDGHYHDLLNDLGKEKVMADIKGWIDAHLAPAS